MYYLDSTVLIPFTLARTVDKSKTKAIDELFSKIDSSKTKCYTSFYSLLEVYLFALNNAKDFEEGCDIGKDALVKILQSKIILLTMTTREQRIEHEHMFRKLKDNSDIPHAILTFINNCRIVTYDSHFDVVEDLVNPITPERLLENLEKQRVVK